MAHLASRRLWYLMPLYIVGIALIILTFNSFDL